MYAIVQFLADNVKGIVPVSDIKNFKPDTFKEDSHPVHETFWKSEDVSITGYYYAVVHLVAETRKELQERKKRIKFLPVKKLEELLHQVPAEENIKGLISNKEIRGKIKAKQEKRTACENKKYLNAINEKLNGTRKRSLSNESREASPCKNRRKVPISPNESSDGDELVLKSELMRITANYKTVLRKLKMKEIAYAQLKSKNEKLQELNVDLQTQLIALLKGNRSVECKPPPTQRLSFKVETRKRGIYSCGQKHLEKVNYDGGLVNDQQTNNDDGSLLDDQQTNNDDGGLVNDQRTNNNGGLLKDQQTNNDDGDFLMEELHQERVKMNDGEMTSVPTLEGNPSSIEVNENLMQREDEQLILAPGVTISKEQWRKVQAAKNLNISRLARNLAVTLWGSETLAQRSVTGAPCKRFKKDGCEGKTPLTPVKIDAVQNGMRIWLKNQGKREEVLQATSASFVRKILADKIMDLKRQEKKNTTKIHI